MTAQTGKGQPAGLTLARERAIHIVMKDRPSAREFALAMWPDPIMHQRFYNCGPNGATRGTNGVAPRRAGAFLRRMERDGLVRAFDGGYRWETTLAGRAALTKEMQRMTGKGQPTCTICGISAADDVIYTANDGSLRCAEHLGFTPKTLAQLNDERKAARQ